VNNQTTLQPIPIAREHGRTAIYAAVLLLVIVGSLFAYKSSSALAVIEKVRVTGTLQPRVNVLPIPGSTAQFGLVARSVNYFLVIWPALLFGILISGAVRLLEPPRWLAESFARGGVRSQLAAGLTGAPLMLCSCCVAPVFSGMYERSSRLGPSLAVMLAAPALNPAALVLTFMLFDYRIAGARLVVAACAVFFTGALIERFIGVKQIELAPTVQTDIKPLLLRFLHSCAQVAVRTLPLITVGVLISMAIILLVPVGALASSGGQLVATIVIALVAVPLAMPTFFEIPLASLLLSAGAPASAVVAIMIAGPAINLPSLFTIARSANWKVAAAVALVIFLFALLAGVFVALV